MSLTIHYEYFVIGFIIIIKSAYLTNHAPVTVRTFQVLTSVGLLSSLSVNFGNINGVNCTCFLRTNVLLKLSST